VKRLIAERTQRIRRGIVKLIAPTFYEWRLDTPRPMIRYISKEFGNEPLVGIEIGVGMGENAKSILRELNMKMLYLVDPYIPYYDGFTQNSEGYLAGLKIVKKELASLPNVTFICKKSEDAVNDIPYEIDFCYIDGNHSYDYVKKDIENYYSKVKSGGVIGGHDFSANFLEVCKAVIEFVTAHHLKLYGERNDWWVIKT